MAYGRVGGLYHRRYTYEKISKAAPPPPPPPEVDMLIDISPTSSYYVTKGANIVHNGVYCCNADCYCLPVTAYSGGDAITEDVEINMQSLMADMTKPVLEVFFGASDSGLRYDTEKSEIYIWVYDKDGNLRGRACRIYRQILHGVTGIQEIMPAMFADLSACKDKNTLLRMRAYAYATAGQYSYAICRMASYARLFDVKS